jgi:hypothetical protein
MQGTEIPTISSPTVRHRTCMKLCRARTKRINTPDRIYYNLSSKDDFKIALVTQQFSSLKKLWFKSVIQQGVDYS